MDTLIKLINEKLAKLNQEKNSLTNQVDETLVQSENLIQSVINNPANINTLPIDQINELFELFSEEEIAKIMMYRLVLQNGLISNSEEDTREIIDTQALADGLLIVVGTTALLATQQEALHQLVLGDIELNHRCHLVAAFREHLLQGLGLRDGAGEAIEDDALVLASEGIIDGSQDVNHQLIGDELALVDEALGCLTKFRAVLDLVAEHIARGDMTETVFLNHHVALRSLAGTGSTENNDILHCILFLLGAYSTIV